MTATPVCLAFLLPVVFDLIKQEADNFTEDKPSSSESIQDYTYLSSEKDVALWKMLVASPTNCNVFVGGLSHDVTSEILQAAFKAFIMDQDDKDQLKVKTTGSTVQPLVHMMATPLLQTVHLASKRQKMMKILSTSVSLRATSLGGGSQESLLACYTSVTYKPL